MKEGMYFSLCLLLGSLTHVESASLSPDVQRNELRFPYGVNFKFNGMLHHNMCHGFVSAGDACGQEHLVTPMSSYYTGCSGCEVT